MHDTVYERLEVTQNVELRHIIGKYNVTRVYYLEAFHLPAEKYPVEQWDYCKSALLTLLDVVGETGVKQITWYAPADGEKTVNGIIRIAGRNWCAWYRKKYGIDIRVQEDCAVYTCTDSKSVTDFKRTKNIFRLTKGCRLICPLYIKHPCC
jgi:hypothetical protein